MSTALQAPAYGSRGKQRTLALPEAATQTFIKGDFLTIDSNGRVQQAVAAGSRLGATSGAITNRIVGRAEVNASGTTGRFVSVMIAEPGTEFLLPVDHATPSSAVPNTNLVGKQFELKHVTAVSPNAAYYAVSLDNNTNVKEKVSDMYTPDHDGYDPTLPGIATAASTVQYGKVWVEFMDEHCIFGGGV
jgi:hypothetical protein